MESRIKMWSKRLLRAGGFWLIVPWALSGCGIPDHVKNDLSALRQQVGLLDQQDRLLRRRMVHIEEYLTYCPDEVQKLVGRVEKECETQEYCSLTEADIRVEVRNVAPWAGGKFLSLMQDRKHIALYPSAEGKLTDADRKQLRDLVLPAWLNDGSRRTRFLVVSHAADNMADSLLQASQRGKRVIREITTIAERMAQAQSASAAGSASSDPPQSGPKPAASIDEGQAAAPPQAAAASAQPEAPSPTPGQPRPLPRYLLHWAVPFPRSNEQLRPEDLPKRGDKLTTSVFVYRVDC